MPLIRSLFAIALIVCMLTSGTLAQNQAAVGNLTCTGGAGVGLIIGSQKSYQCSFTPVDGGGLQRYTATVTKIGVDIGVTGNTVMVWSVLAAGAQVQSGFLAGNYTGVSADAAIGLGGGAKVLVGGSSKSIVLQPLSVQGQTGVNLAVGIAGMTIR
jgi:hypothetical protein